MTIRIKHVKKTAVTANEIKSVLKGTVGTTKKLKLPSSTWRGTTKDLIINWGSSNPLDPNTRAYVMNSPKKVALAVDKLKTFEVLTEAGLGIPDYAVIDSVSDKSSQIVDFLQDTLANSIVLRSTLTGSGGEGIFVLTDILEKTQEYHEEYDIDDLQDFSRDQLLDVLTASVPLSVIRDTVFVGVYFRAIDEYRVHIMCGKVIATQRKALRNDGLRPEDPDFTVRSHSNGFIFQINNIDVPEEVLQASKDAVQALGLDFGAVDIRYNDYRETYKILEVNSAPALVGATLQAYTSGFLVVHEYLQTRTPSVTE